MKIDGPKKPTRSQPAKGPPAQQAHAAASRDTDSPINLKHLLILLGLGILVLVVLSLALESYWNRPQPAFQDAPKLVRALQAFSRDQFVHGKQLPAAVSLNDLVVEGYLSKDDIRAFEGIEVTFSNVQTNQDSPQVMIHARLPDGTVLAVLADGSVQQLKK